MLSLFLSRFWVQDHIGNPIAFLGGAGNVAAVVVTRRIDAVGDSAHQIRTRAVSNSAEVAGVYDEHIVLPVHAGRIVIAHQGGIPAFSVITRYRLLHQRTRIR